MDSVGIDDLAGKNVLTDGNETGENLAQKAH